MLFKLWRFAGSVGLMSLLYQACAKSDYPPFIQPDVSVFRKKNEFKGRKISAFKCQKPSIKLKNKSFRKIIQSGRLKTKKV